jgi:predicted GIY-YIG superfamily endonuclease
MNAFVYILESASGRLYVGSTDDLSRRLRQHAKGHTQTTRNLRTDNLVVAQGYQSPKDARAIEARIKKLTRRDDIEKMIKDGYIRLRE